MIKKKCSLRQFSILTLLIIFFCFIFLCYVDKVFLINADLGRHIKNGEIFFQQGFPISANHYSYTHPEYPTVNHHWASGVMFYLVNKWQGFQGLAIFNILIQFFTFLLFFYLAVKKSNYWIAILLALLSAKLFSHRTEIRPETFSCFFMGIYFCLLYQFKEKRIPYWVLFFIPFLQVAWVNMHILFCVGLFIIGVFCLDAFFNEKDKNVSIKLLAIGILSAFACLLNPSGIDGALIFLSIFKQYGYKLAENQSVLFMQKRSPGKLLYVHFEIIFLLCFLSIIPAWKKDGFRKNLIPFLLFCFFGILAWKLNRALAMFGLFFMPIAAINLNKFVFDLNAKRQHMVRISALILSIMIMALWNFFPRNYMSPCRDINNLALPSQGNALNLGCLGAICDPLKLMQPFYDVNGSAYFMKRLGIKGPIFNNYDIGGYLIYHFFPKEKVFVDNRPEAYPASFFKDLYVPMQENEDVWRKADEQYQFNVIYFYRHDLTPWGQKFLISRIGDPKWAPVFVDRYAIIFLKENKQNRHIINKYKLPRSMFRIRKI